MIRPFVFLLFITLSFNQVRNEEIIDIVPEVDNSSIISNDLLMSVEEFFKCIAQAEPIANDIYDMIKAIKAKDYKSMISFKRHFSPFKKYSLSPVLYNLLLTDTV